MKFYLKLLIVVILFSSFLNPQKVNPLVGEWSFIEGFSNGKPTFEKELKRKKFFKKDFSFFITQMNNGNPVKTIDGNYEIINKNQFKEILGKNFSVTYEFKIKNDTLNFNGVLLIPLKNGNFKHAKVKEKWVKIK